MELFDSADLKARIKQEGFFLVGVAPAVRPPHYEAYRSWIRAGMAGEMSYLAKHADQKSNVGHLLPGAQSVIVCGLNYHQENRPIPGLPRLASYALGRDYHKVLRAKLRRVVRFLETKYPESRQRVCVDSAPLMERDFAQLAGLGWFGKNTMLINSKKGSRFVLGTILSTLAFEPDKPALGSCGNCTKCIDACPTGAIKHFESRWSVDARECISYLTIEKRGDVDASFSDKISDWTFGCDICQDVCPFNEGRPSQPERAEVTSEPDFLQRRLWPPLEEICELNEVAWDQLTRGSPVRRAGHKGLLRNAHINRRNLLP